MFLSLFYIIYEDSEGRIDGVISDDEGGVIFYHLGAESYYDAKTMIEALKLEITKPGMR